MFFINIVKIYVLFLSTSFIFDIFIFLFNDVLIIMKIFSRDEFIKILVKVFNFSLMA